MKTIKIFLASSEELDDDRNAFGNLIRRLNKSYEKRGIRLDLFEWEDFDAAYNDRRKQDEYNDEVRASDMFLAVFYKKAGQFTIEEFNIAKEEFLKKSSPKIYTYCKDLQAGETESPELAEFKYRLINEMGHYWSRYSNRDTMQLHFVMQLQLVESSIGDSLKIDDGNITLNGLHIAKMENLPFAGLNEDFCRMNSRLTELPAKIAKAHSKVEKYPDEEDFRDEEQALTDEYNTLRERFSEYQHNLFTTAQRIARLQGERTTERMRRAMEAFNDGRISEANIILNEAEHDATLALDRYRQSREMTEQHRQNVINSIEEILLKCSTILADLSIPVEERIESADRLYTQADEMAHEADYDKTKYSRLLIAYKTFLNYYGLMDKSLEIHLRLCDLTEQINGLEHIDTAMTYNDIGATYNILNNYHKALEYHQKAEPLFCKIDGTEAPSTATSHHNIGAVYSNLGDYPRALEYLFMSAKVRGNTPDLEPDLADTYNNIGGIYIQSGDNVKGLEYLRKALLIYERVLGNDEPDIARTCQNIGIGYYGIGDYARAAEYYHKATAIYEKTLGPKSRTTAKAYANLGIAYVKLGDTKIAIGYYKKALSTFRKLFGDKHDITQKIAHAIATIDKTLSD